MATGSEGTVQKLKVRLLEKSLSRTDGVRGIGDDDIISGSVIREEFETIADENGNSRIVEEGRHMRKELLGNTDDGLFLDASRSSCDD